MGRAKKDYESLTASLEKLNEMQGEPQRVDLSNVRKIIANDFREIYNSLTREEKRTLWKNTLKEIRVDNTTTITGISFF